MSYPNVPYTPHVFHYFSSSFLKHFLLSKRSPFFFEHFHLRTVIYSKVCFLLHDCSCFMISMLITCYKCYGTIYIYALCDLYFSFSRLYFFGFPDSHHLLPLKLHFFFFFFSFPSLAFPFEMAQTKTTPNPPPSIDYKSLYRWAPNSLLAETSQINTFKDIEAYKKSESDEKFHVFGREQDVYVKVLPCREGEPVCVNNRADPEEPFFFMYATAFKRLKLRLPFRGFERALLNEVNVAPSQLHPNSWAFVQAFGILCNHLGHTPSHGRGPSP